MHDFYGILSSFQKKLSWKTSILLRFEILGLFVNAFITDDKFFRHNTVNYPQPIPMQSSKKKQKVFVETLLRF